MPGMQSIRSENINTTIQCLRYNLTFYGTSGETLYTMTELNRLIPKTQLLEFSVHTLQTADFENCKAGTLKSVCLGKYD